jgi:hypothetical protein
VTKGYSGDEVGQKDIIAIVKNDVLLAHNRQSEKFPMPVLTTRFELSLRGRKPVVISNPENNEIA